MTLLEIAFLALNFVQLAALATWLPLIVSSRRSADRREQILRSALEEIGSGLCSETEWVAQHALKEADEI